MDTGLGFGGAIYGQGTHGKGVMQAFIDLDSTATVKSFGVAQWEGTQFQADATTSLTNYGGLLKGGTALILASTVMQDRPNFVWAGFDTASEQSNVYTSGYIAWDGQLIPDATWTTQIID